MAWNYSNTSVETTLTSSINSSTTSIAVGSTSGLPVTFPFTLILDFEQASVEVVTVTGLASLNLTVIRGEDGTAAQSHNAGARVVHGVVARDVREPQTHMAASQDVHGVGVGNSVVGTGTTQTLTNKTISGANNTLTAIPDSAITSISASKVTQPFVRLRAVGADGANTVLDVVADEGTRTVDVATMTRNGVGLQVTKDGNVVIDDGELIVDTAGSTLTNGSRVTVKNVAGKAGIRVRRATVGATDDLQDWQDETGTNLARVTSAGVLIGTGATVNGNATVTGTLGVTGTTTLGVANTGALGVTGAATVSGNVTGADFLVGTRHIPDETVRRFASAAARSSAIPSPVEGMVTTLDDVGGVDLYDSAAWVPLGPFGIKNMRGVFGGTQTFNSTSYATVTGISLTFTKKRTDTNVLVKVNVSGSTGNLSGYQMIVGVNFSGVGDFEVCNYFWTNDSIKMAFGGEVTVLAASLAAGTYTVLGRARIDNVTSGRFSQVQAGDMMSVTCQEIPA